MAHKELKYVGGPVRLMLDISTAHLPEKYGSEQSLEALSELGHLGIIADALERGFLMWVPEDPEGHTEEFYNETPPEILAIQVYARKLDCDYVRFDADADTVEDLPTWEW